MRTGTSRAVPSPERSNDPRTVKIFAPQTRLDVAKTALTGIINNLHPDIDTRLMTFAGCFRQPDHGVFSAAQRPQLITGIQGLNANEGTPLASGLKKAARQVNGRDRDAVIVMFVDGDDGCNENVCKVAQRIAVEQPRLRVNVVNIGDSSLSNCITRKTPAAASTPAVTPATWPTPSNMPLRLFQSANDPVVA